MVAIALKVLAALVAIAHLGAAYRHPAAGVWLATGRLSEGDARRMADHGAIVVLDRMSPSEVVDELCVRPI